jgi:hypothetical protein
VDLILVLERLAQVDKQMTALRHECPNPQPCLSIS